MNTIIHKSDSRGHINHGWLNTYHTFSFASYYNPERMSFGTLRVLNDDVVAPGTGFGTHPHENMEIITIPLSGVVEHKDSMGHVHNLTPDEIQVMSAGSGIFHSERNGSSKEEAALLQLWIIPEKMNIVPRYNQKRFKAEDRLNKIHKVVGPKEDAAPLWINQQAYIYLSEIEPGNTVNYKSEKGNNGTYIFVIDGEIKIEENELSARDGIGITEADEFSIKATDKSSLLILSVPMRR